MGWFDDLTSFGRKAYNGAKNFGRKAAAAVRYGAKKVGSVLQTAKKVTTARRNVPVVGSVASPVLDIADTAISYGEKWTRIAEGVAGGIEKAVDAKSFSDLGKAAADVERSIRQGKTR